MAAGVDPAGAAGFFLDLQEDEGTLGGVDAAAAWVAAYGGCAQAPRRGCRARGRVRCLLSTEGVYSRDMGRGNSREGGGHSARTLGGPASECSAPVRRGARRAARGSIRERLQARCVQLVRRDV